MYVDQVNISFNGKRSVEYAKCRAAINMDAHETFKDNAAGAKNWLNANKNKAVKILGGTIAMIEGKKFVIFPDESKARF
jgi:hypothetical protein